MHALLRLTVALAAVALLAASSTPDSAATPAPKDAPGATPKAAIPRPLKAFYCTHSAGFVHECLPLTREIMARLGKEHDWLDITVSNEVADLTSEVLGNLDVLILYTSGTLPMSEAQKEALQALVARGAGIVGVHSASDTFHDWDWFVRTMGGEFDGHPWHERVGITVRDASHPATRHLAPRFEIVDEIYQFKRLNDDRRTLMELDPESVTHSIKAGRAYPLAWTLEFGEAPRQGRVFYTALGHRDEVWKDQRFIDHLIGGIRWAGRAEP